MTNMKLIFRTAAATAVVSFALGGTCAVQAQAYPAKPLRMIIPFVPGGASDITGRLAAIKLQETLGQSVVVENRGGAGGLIGAELVAKSAPDGYTLLATELTPIVTGTALYPTLGFDPLRDLTPVAMFSYSPHVLTVAAGHPAKSVQELVAYGKANPNKLSYASPGSGSAPHLAAALFGQQAGFQWTHIPYKGAAAAMIDVAGGQVDGVMNSMLASQPLIAAGKLRVLALSSETRNSRMPDAPTISESAVPGFFTGSFQGLLAPTGTPGPIIQRLNTEIGKMLQQREVIERFATQGTEPRPMTPPQFADFLRADSTKWRKVIQDVNIKAD
jgi:tripartite-type tricarboxylate transporter receptor subunit TctC